ncbi:winged helix-turn-helix transcriptional regulator [Halorubrum sp. BOL3-1]|uniref:winged helix-turn-helix transcriptional regulator n=1 Tax=Halorubrum sp. BOL3-1 TaxID=2497325 RepID=UPI001005043E|nr:winged helix-turn-helix transcriptional regulator [Halorubrum sp. BOL3-1]QAU12000.1 winged helix-turn-helix transcriptional regulator [Halorubrum sp. BOL3-1]
MTDTRTQIRRHVRDTPGVHFNQVGRDLDIATGQVQYHLRRLVRNDELAIERVGGRTHYFAPSFDSCERRALAFLRRETARGILVRLHADGPKRPKTLANDLDLARSTVSWHVSALVENEIVEKSADRPVTVSLARPERTAALLDEVSPSLPDRIVDRFVRTVDTIFESSTDH